MKRPTDLVPPKTLSPSPPVPQPEEVKPAPAPLPDGRLEPTRFGDWEKNGIAIDF
jgi:hypothetical protein